LARALNTTDTAVANANKNNILFLTKDIPSYQATITIYTMVNGTVVGTTTKNVNASNTNVVKWVLLSSAQTTTVATTTVPVAPTSTVAQVGQSGQTAGSNNNMLLYAGVVIVVIIVIVVAFVAMRRKK
jgi:LPXTG-motif cell wall-anchored protein